MSEGKYFELSLNGTQLCVGEKCDRKEPVLCHHAEKDANQVCGAQLDSISLFVCENLEAV